MVDIVRSQAMLILEDDVEDLQEFDEGLDGRIDSRMQDLLEDVVRIHV